jgi:hypothetical protein
MKVKYVKPRIWRVPPFDASEAVAGTLAVAAVCIVERGGLP